MEEVFPIILFIVANVDRDRDIPDLGRIGKSRPDRIPRPDERTQSSTGTGIARDLPVIVASDAEDQASK
jgi:hypothetical protein